MSSEIILELPSKNAVLAAFTELFDNCFSLNIKANEAIREYVYNKLEIEVDKIILNVEFNCDQPKREMEFEPEIGTKAKMESSFQVIKIDNVYIAELKVIETVKKY